MQSKREKKIVQKVQTSLLSSSGKVPADFVEYQFCKEFSVMPHHIDQLPEQTYELYLGFMRAEMHAADIRSKRAKQKAN